MRPDRKRQLVRAVERYAANPAVKATLRLGVPLRLLALLETTGRETGKPRRTPVMNGLVGNEFWIVAEHGYRAGYVRNLMSNPHVRVKTGSRWMEGTAHILDDDDPLARTEWIAEQLGRSRKVEVLGLRLFSVEPVTIRVDVVRDQAARREGLRGYGVERPDTGPRVHKSQDG